MELHLDVDVVLVWNSDPFLEENGLVSPGVHARKSYPFALQEVIQRLTLL